MVAEYTAIDAASVTRSMTTPSGMGTVARGIMVIASNEVGRWPRSSAAAANRGACSSGTMTR